MSAVLRLVTPVAPLPEPDAASLPEQLRQIAFDVECGLLVGSTSAVVIIDGAPLMIYGIGPGDKQSRLNAAHMLLALGQRELERIGEEVRQRE